MRLKLSELVSPIHAGFSPVYGNPLLQEGDWVQTTKWLCDAYNDIAALWMELKKPEQDKLLFTETNPKLGELLHNLFKVSSQTPWMTEINQQIVNAGNDFETAEAYSQSGEYASAVLFQSYSLTKIKSVLESLNLEAGRPPRSRVSSFGKKAYGYDISGETFEGSGEIANRENQKNIDDTAEPQDHHETPPNPLNLLHDADADKEFPNLAEYKNKRVYWPPRTR